jgi:hypothetical protein
MSVSGELLGSIKEIYEGKRTAGQDFKFESVGQFLALIPEKDRLEAYKLYVGCISTKTESSIQQFIVSHSSTGRNLEIVVSNPSDYPALITRLVYSQGVSSKEMTMITMCCMYCMTAWYTINSGIVPTIRTPGSRVENTIQFVGKDTDKFEYDGRIMYAPGCGGLLYSQIEMDVSVEVLPKSLTRVVVGIPRELDKIDKPPASVPHNPLIFDKSFTVDGLIAPKDMVCVRVFLNGNKDESSLCNARTEMTQTFLP